jgi:hypothetical protein
VRTKGRLPGMSEYPQAQRQNFQNRLLAEIDEKISDGTSYNDAFSLTSLSWLGQDEDLKSIDAAGDRAFDYYKIYDNEVQVFQFKSQDVTRGFDTSAKAGPEFLADVRRILEFFETIEEPKHVGNRALQTFRKEVISEMAGMRQTDAPKSTHNKDFQITINLVCLYQSFTPLAAEEFHDIQRKHEIITVHGVDVLCQINAVMIDELIAEKWKQSNIEWKDNKGKKEEWIEVRCLQAPIDAKRCLVTFVNASDLVDAYVRFGYQIFESNVRCEIKKSDVNKSIRHQIRTQKGIEEFMYLNNGLTIICKNRTMKKQTIRMHIPQIVNGLQTVTTLADEYHKLPAELREYFDRECYVLMRLYDTRTVSDVPKLVRGAPACRLYGRQPGSRGT